MTLQLEVGGDRPATSKGLLAAIRFDQTHEISDDPRQITIGLPPLDGASPVECWRTEGEVECGRHGEIAYAGDGRLLFGHLLLDDGTGHDLEAVGHHGYNAILDLLAAFGGLHLLRVWNYVRDINHIEDDLERYRSFCVGRSRALADRGVPEQALPAATGVGSTSPGLMISFLAAPTLGRQVENPRQVSAFRYPRRYGPKSPSFSRALVYPSEAGQSLLFISGTASIVGHETRHVGLLGEQCDETFRNLGALIEAAGDGHAFRSLRVYIRHPHQTEAVLAECRRRFGGQMPIIPLASNICRRDLLVEIEGLASAGSVPGVMGDPS